MRSRVALAFVAAMYVSSAGPTVLAAPAEHIATTAAPARAPVERVVLADPDPELRHALHATLAPWRLEIVVETEPPDDASRAEQLAKANGARYVVWRRGDGELAVFDRARGSAQYREGKPGALDAPTAASTALTVKTLMRLPAPPPPGRDARVATASHVTTEPMVAATVDVPPSRELRVQASIASRLARGSETSLGARFAGAIFVRPRADLGLRFGLAAELGTASSVSGSGFRGTWSDSAALALVGWGFDRGRWQLEPHVGVGVSRSKLRGMEMSTARAETDTLAVVVGGAWLRRRLGHFSVGAGLDVVVSPGTPTYTRASSATELFRVPGLGVTLGLVSAFDMPL